jgi:hypothetical protein
MALARSPEGGSPPPPDLGARFSQKRVWFIWPPVEFRQCRSDINATLFVSN